jgi:AraC family transcriptional regulator
MMDVKIVDFAELKVAAMEHRGPPELLNNSARRLSEWRKETNLSPKERCKTLGVAYDNPDTTDPQEFRFDICGEVSADVPATPPGRGEQNHPRRSLCRGASLWFS